MVEAAVYSCLALRRFLSDTIAERLKARLVCLCALHVTLCPICTACSVSYPHKLSLVIRRLGSLPSYAVPTWEK